ncbi:hypothetical protein FVA77_09605 [Phyllobacterium endophyticum]|nr:hypothetical protein FVA77_09605 [Phyllobacterium endophyticum]
MRSAHKLGIPSAADSLRYSTGERFCINSGSLAFTSNGQPLSYKLGRGDPEANRWIKHAIATNLSSSARDGL